MAVASLRPLRPVVQNWDWQRRAACRGMDSALFSHPEGERGAARASRVRAAVEICSTCPVREECRRWAHAAREPYGVWGGESEDDRRSMLRHPHSAEQGQPTR